MTTDAKDGNEPAVGSEKESLQFHCQQYQLLNSEIQSLVGETRRMEIYVVGAMAAIYVWAFKDGIAHSRPALWIPVGLSFFGAIRSLALFKRVGELAVYQRKIEDLLLATSILKGWENFFFDLTHRKSKSVAEGSQMARLLEAGWLSGTATIVWIVLALGSLWIAVGYDVPKDSSSSASQRQLTVTVEPSVTSNSFKALVTEGESKPAK